MIQIFINALPALKLRLKVEQEKVDKLLKECKQEKVQPPKDYWHNLYELKQKVRTYEQMIERGK